MSALSQTAEYLRLQDNPNIKINWNLWGPYVSERQWGTVREDYSKEGAAWDYLTHDQARSRAYRWGEDGIAGICDHRQRLCFTVAFWNGKDSIIKERIFGLTNSEGNHGEDVKEIYSYVDATPTHSYLKMNYKYPQAAFPYQDLVETNRHRSKDEPEYELIDTGIFNEDKYFDVFVEYAKESPTDILIKITVHNRGPVSATLHLLPHLFFRNKWDWVNPDALSTVQIPKPNISRVSETACVTSHALMGAYTFNAEGANELLFCENETNVKKLYNVDKTGFFKDGINDYIVHQKVDAVNHKGEGTKVAAHYLLNIPAKGSHEVRLRLSNVKDQNPFADFDTVFAKRLTEADNFFAAIQTPIDTDDAKLVHRQACAGMIWSKQYYAYDIREWLNGDPGQMPPPEQRKSGRNSEWTHVNNADIISMPDKWEYPWYAAWDLAFHCVVFSQFDPAFAKEQLVLITREWYMHPNGALPAYEWAFGDVNPPVHAWASWEVYNADRDMNGKADVAFLERVFHKLMLNFTWWVNRKDSQGRNIFQGGFLGLDNIGVFDRSAPLPTGGFINQADGTSWMAMYCLNMLRIALELARYNTVYQDIASKFFEHFLHIAEALNKLGGSGLWDEADQFYYDQLNLPNGTSIPLKVHSLVGLVPLFAVEVLEADITKVLPEFAGRMNWFLSYRSDLATLVSRWEVKGEGQTQLLSLLRGHRMKKLLNKMLDESEFLSEFGIRAVSRIHRDHPYVFNHNGTPISVSYQPGESNSGLFGGNSNWRGPIWMPMNYLLIQAVRKFHSYYGDEFKVECPTGSGKFLNLSEVADELSHRVTRIFLKDENGHRPVFRHAPRQQADPHFNDHVWFYEYFHGETGRGVGATHQTGWSGLVAKLLMAKKPTPK